MKCLRMGSGHSCTVAANVRRWTARPPSGERTFSAHFPFDCE
jgi:hypothetical protein